MTTHATRIPVDVGDEQWALVAWYLTLMTERAPQRQHSLRALFNGCATSKKRASTWKDPCARSKQRPYSEQKMIQTAALGESPIPPPSILEQERQEARRGAELAAALVAIGKLLMIVTFLRIMKLFGYEFRRRRAKPAHSSAQRPAAAACTALKLRRRHKYIDRDACLALLAQANEAIGAARSAGTPPPEPAPTIELPQPRVRANAPHKPGPVPPVFRRVILRAAIPPASVPKLRNCPGCLCTS